jgi:hypothetical protein
MHLVEFEPTIPASARPQTYALDRAAAGIGLGLFLDDFVRRSDVVSSSSNNVYDG